MTERPDPIDLLLAQSTVPAVAPDLAARIVAEAQRPSRARSAPPPRRREWSRARRGAWTAVIAVNIVLASAVAAAIDGGGRYLPEPIARATHHLVERLRSHLPSHWRAAAHHAPAPLLHPAAPPRRALPSPPPTAFQRPIAPPEHLLRPSQVWKPPLHRQPAPLRPRLHRPMQSALAGVHVPHRSVGPWHAGVRAEDKLRPDGWLGPKWRHQPAWRDRPGWAGPGRRGDRWRDGPGWASPRFGRGSRGPRGPGPHGRRFR